LVGQHVGKYRVVRELGRGGMGIVYEVVQDLIGHRAAMKVIPGRLADHPKHANYVARFQDEARAVNLIDHPGVVRIFDFGDLPDKTVYILMEFLDGETLFSRLSAIREGRAPRITLMQAARFTQQIASIMSRAHDKGVIHRDIKPDNIILVKDPGMPGGERLKLLDFGLAKFLDSAERRTTAGMAIGTPIYMSPEQCQGLDTIDGKSDVYAAGCMLFEMLSGSPPFTGEIGQIMRQHVFTPPPILSDRIAGVPNEVVALVGQMLNKNPQLRPDMKQLEARVEQLMERGVLGSKDKAGAPSQDTPSDAHAATMAMPLAKRPAVADKTERVGTVNRVPAKLASLGRVGLALALCTLIAGFGGGLLVGALRERPCPQHSCPPPPVPETRPAPPPEPKPKTDPAAAKPSEPAASDGADVDTAKPKKGAKGKKAKKPDPGSVF
jgi:serine/threonine-protein kinase